MKKTSYMDKGYHSSGIKEITQWWNTSVFTKDNTLVLLHKDPSGLTKKPTATWKKNHSSYGYLANQVQRNLTFVLLSEITSLVLLSSIAMECHWLIVLQHNSSFHTDYLRAIILRYSHCCYLRLVAWLPILFSMNKVNTQ